MKHHIVVVWDFREQINVEEVNRALSKIKNARLFEVETGGDSCAVVVAPAGTTRAEAQASLDEITTESQEVMRPQSGNFLAEMRARRN